MKTLNPKIVEKLSKDLVLSESTIKKNIYLLAKQYPRATKNALGQIYARQNKKTVLRMLDNEDRLSFPSDTAIIRNPTPISRAQKTAKPAKKPEVKQSFVKKHWKKGLVGGALTFFILPLLVQLLGTEYQIRRYKDDSTTKFSTPTISPILTPFPIVIPSSSPTSTNSLLGNNQISIDEGKSFTDPVSDITVGVNWVLPRNYSNLTITFPGRPSEEYRDVKSGRRFDYVGRDNLDYVLTVVEVEPSGIKVKIDRKPR